MPVQTWIVIALLSLSMFMSVAAGKLTKNGAFTGGLLGFAIYLGAGFTGILLLGVFFILGSVATSWKFKFKQNLGLAELNKGRRTASQAIANAGVPAILGILAWAFPEHAEVFRLMLAAAFASATADTLSSELGNVYGRKFYNILTWQKDKRGLDGVISLEGTSCGALGSAFIGLLYVFGFGWSLNVAWVILAGICGNLFDSVLGATLERQHHLPNDAVNFLNTLFAALVAGALYVIV